MLNHCWNFSKCRVGRVEFRGLINIFIGIKRLLHVGDGSGLRCKETRSLGQHRLKVCYNRLKEDFIKLLCLRNWSGFRALEKDSWCCLDVWGHLSPGQGWDPDSLSCGSHMEHLSWLLVAISFYSIPSSSTNQETLCMPQTPTKRENVPQNTSSNTYMGNR